MAPKLYLMQLSPPCRAVLMVAKAVGVELDVEEVEREALRTPEMLEVKIHPYFFNLENKN